ncbi:tetratricopeptide repeat protein [Nonomuraea sp. NPDC049480]|uniref:tetratricopeptide repeat protein n=1 Tax=Nonomuraea sp. NPDC049480 TaxID=3364353 RepID=UPI0037A7ED42
MSGAEGDHIEFHHNRFTGKVVGAEHHHHYPPRAELDPIVEGDVPQRPSDFQPRPELLQQLASLLGDQAAGQCRGGESGGAVAVCALGGTPGVGKTLLAASYAWACQAARWQVVAWIAAETTEQIMAGMAALADRLGERRPDDDVVAAAARAKAWLAATNRPALLVFDNATDVALVRSWCPATGATRVIITTRNRSFLRAYAPLDVGVFTPAEASAFLHRRTGLTDPAGAAELADELGHLPLALAQAATVIARLRLSYSGYLTLLRGVPLSNYLPAQTGDAYPSGTAEAIVLSIAQVEETLPFAGQLLAILAVLSPTGIPLTVLYHLSDTSGAESIGLREMLADLSDTCLITFSDDGNAVLMHRLVQRVLRDCAAHQGDLATVLNEAIALLGAFAATLPTGARAWEARDVVEMLVEQVDVLYRRFRTDDNHPAELLTLRSLCGRYLYDLADLTRAIPLLQQTLADRERVLGADHPDTLNSRNNLAYVCRKAGDLTRAIPLYEQALADRERVLGAEHPDTLTSRNNLALAYQMAGDLTRAIPLYEQALADRERVLGAEHPDTLSSRNNLAVAYQDAGDRTRAMPLLQQALADRVRVLGADHPDTLSARNNLAVAYQTAGDLIRAIPLYEQILIDRERVLSADHPDTLTFRNNLAFAYLEVGDLTRAMPLLQQALADRERVLGAEHPDTLSSRNNLAGAYRAEGDLIRAIPLCEQTLVDRERVLGADHPDTLTSRNNLAGAYQDAGDLIRAIALYEQTLIDRERVLSAEHPETLSSRNNLAVACKTSGDLTRAISLCEQTLADRERVLGTDHPDTLTSRNNLATAYSEVGDLTRAIPLLQQTVTDCERVLGADHPKTRVVRRNLAAALASDPPRSPRLWMRLLGQGRTAQ